MWILYAFLCAFFAATADYLVKRYVKGFEDLEISFARILPAVPILWSFALYDGIPSIDLSILPAYIVGVPLEIAALLLITKALRISPLSSTIPFLSFSPVFLLVTSPLIMKEYPSLVGVAGVLVVVLGAYLLNVGSGKGVLDPFKEIVKERGSLYVLIAAFIYSITSNVGKIGIIHSSPAFFGASYFTVIAVVLGVMTIGKHGFSLFLKKEVLAIGFFSGLMILFHNIAISMANVSYMIAVKRSALLFSILYGIIFLKEKGGIRKLIGGICMLSGIALIAIWG